MCQGSENMSMLVLATLLQLGSSQLSLAQAETLARRDEASLSAALTSDFAARQGTSVGSALRLCGAANLRQAAGLKIIMRLDAQGRVTKTWLNKSTTLGRCLDRRVQSFVLPTDGRPEFYSFINFNFEPNKK